MGGRPLIRKSRRAVFLDRDGVLNHALVRDGRPGSPSNLDEFVIVDEAVRCVDRLRQLGFLTIVVTNQPDVARGRQSASVVEAMHHRLRSALPLDDILVCLHDDRENCACRKPRPGLLLEAQQRHAVDLANSFLIGDRWKDVDAAHAAGCTAVLIDRCYVEPAPRHAPHARVPTLELAVEWIKQRSTSCRHDLKIFA
jgi:D-glycero-D-manno-heptose 1,7-bisphosphate phosphatase